MARAATKEPETEVGVRPNLEFTKPKEGDLTVEAFGASWGPIACGEHNAVPAFDANSVHHKAKLVKGQPEIRPVIKKGKVEHEEINTDRHDLIAPTPDGFDPKCDACAATLDSVLDHARRNATV